MVCCWESKRDKAVYIEGDNHMDFFFVVLHINLKAQASGMFLSV